MRVLVACEFSGIVRDAFIARGHDAVSCDLLPTERPGPHLQRDIFDVLVQFQWDMIIFFYPCTRLCNSGVRWLAERNLWNDMNRAAAEFRVLLDWDRIPKRAGENPIPHKYAVEWIGKYDQIVHPWEHGHPETKSTCLWLRGLPALKPTNVVSGRTARVHRESPGPDRWKRRSRTYQGIAAAMAEQWG